MYKFANKIFDYLNKEEPVHYISSLHDGVEIIENIRKENPNLQIVVLLDIDGTIQNPNKAYQYKFPGISYLRWRLGTPDPFPDEYMGLVKRLTEFSDVCFATNRQNYLGNNDIFQTGLLMETLRNRMLDFEISIPIFSNLNKQIPQMFRNKYNSIIDWIKENSNSDRKVMIISLADLDVATITNTAFLNKILKLAIKSGLNATKLRIDIA